MIKKLYLPLVALLVLLSLHVARWANYLLTIYYQPWSVEAIRNRFCNYYRKIPGKYFKKTQLLKLLGFEDGKVAAK